MHKLLKKHKNQTQQIIFFVLCITGNALHFCIVNEEQRRRGEKKRDTLTTLQKLFMRLYTGNRAAQKCAAFFLPLPPGISHIRAGEPVVEILYKKLISCFLYKKQQFFYQNCRAKKPGVLSFPAGSSRRTFVSSMSRKNGGDH